MRDLSRREFLEVTGAGAAVLLGVGACEGGAPGLGVPGDGSAEDAPVRLDATPECVETEDNDIGPAYLPGAPMRTDLNVLGWAGVPLVISGTVRGTSCEPIPAALVDVWQADDAGCYDGSPIDLCGAVGPVPEWPLRGRMNADAQGRYQFTTIRPGLYPGRTRHIHIIVSAPGYVSLTTQIYFAGEPGNATDGLYEKALEITVEGDETAGLEGDFPIVLRPA